VNEVIAAVLNVMSDAHKGVLLHFYFNKALIIHSHATMDLIVA